MENIVNLNDRRPKAKPTMTEEQMILCLERMLEQYVDSVYESAPMGLIEMYAKDSIEREIRSIPFDQAFKLIEENFPDIACQFKKDMP